MSGRSGDRRAQRAGFTLIEAVLAVGLLGVFVGSTVVLGRKVLEAFRGETALARHDEVLHVALDRMAQRLRAVDGLAVLPGGAGPSSWVEFQRASDHDGNAVVWGPVERLELELEEGELDDGADNDGDGLVDEGRAVWIQKPAGLAERRIVLASSVAELGRGELANGLDDDGDGLADEGGLAFEVVGSRMRIALTLTWRDEGGRLQTIEAERVVGMRNTGVNAP